MPDNSFPLRAPSHVIDNTAKNLLRVSLPQEWILRDQPENDYGIDFHLEFIDEHNQVMGQVAAIQLKGTSTGNEDSPEKPRTITIKRKTLNLWKAYETPVFIVLIDINTQKTYLKSIENEKRKDPTRYLLGQSETITIQFNEFNIVDLKKLFSHYQFAKALRAMDRELPLIMTIHRDFIKLFERYQRDGHMPVDGDGTFNPENFESHYHERRIRYVYAEMRKISSLIGVEWNIPSINETIHTNNWYDEGSTEMYEFHFTMILEQLDRIFQKILKTIKIIITAYKDFWRKRNPEFAAYALKDHPLFSKLTWDERLPYLQNR